MDIFESLRNDHDKQRTLIELLCATHGDSRGRHELFERLRMHLEKHAKAEERFFYVPLMGTEMQERARHSVAEHQEIDDLLEDLASTSNRSPGWLATARKLQERLIHHLDEEETEVFQLAGKYLTAAQERDLAARYRQSMDDEQPEPAGLHA